MAKGDEHPGVKATKVIDVFPFIQMVPNKMIMVTCDDVIEEELTNKKSENNDFLLHNFKDKNDLDVKKYALYKFNDCENLPDDLREQMLGSKRKGNTLEELE